MLYSCTHTATVGVKGLQKSFSEADQVYCLSSVKKQMERIVFVVGEGNERGKREIIGGVLETREGSCQVGSDG